jgi:hypothetical protein
MDNTNSFISIYGLIVASLSGGMMWAGYNIVVKDEADQKKLVRHFIGGSWVVAGVYMFVPSVFRNRWFGTNS